MVIVDHHVLDATKYMREHVSTFVSGGNPLHSALPTARGICCYSGIFYPHRQVTGKPDTVARRQLGIQWRTKQSLKGRKRKSAGTSDS
jgi:hypothetical protein